MLLKVIENEQHKDIHIKEGQVKQYMQSMSRVSLTVYTRGKLNQVYASLCQG